jgi:hypothetical protein
MTKHSWSRKETIICCFYYIEKGMDGIDDAREDLPISITKNSIKMKFQNCLWLDRANSKEDKVKGGLANCSKLHKEIWILLKKIYEPLYIPRFLNKS